VRRGAAISIAISILFPLTWQWRSIIDCNIERHVFPITAPALSISLRRQRQRRRTLLPRIRIHFVRLLLFPFDLPFVAQFLVPVIIIARIGEAETGEMGRKNAVSKGGAPASSARARTKTIVASCIFHVILSEVCESIGTFL